MKVIKYIFFSLILLFKINNVYANNYTLYNNNINEIEESLNKYNQININLNINNNELIVNRKVLDLIKNKDKVIVYNIIDNNEILYSYKFNGKYFNKSYNNINLNINFNIKNEIINEYFNNKIVFNTEYNGYYPKGTILSIRNNKFKKNINLYSLNDKEFNKIKINKNNNYIEFEINKGNTYILSNKKLVSMNVIKIYIIILIILFIEIIIFSIIIYLKRDIEIPKLK